MLTLWLRYSKRSQSGIKDGASKPVAKVSALLACDDATTIIIQMMDFRSLSTLFSLNKEFRGLPEILWNDSIQVPGLEWQDHRVEYPDGDILDHSRFPCFECLPSLCLESKSTMSKFVARIFFKQSYHMISPPLAENAEKYLYLNSVTNQDPELFLVPERIGEPEHPYEKFDWARMMVCMLIGFNENGEFPHVGGGDVDLMGLFDAVVSPAAIKLLLREYPKALFGQMFMWIFLLHDETSLLLLYPLVEAYNNMTAAGRWMHFDFYDEDERYDRGDQKVIDLRRKLKIDLQSNLAFGIMRSQVSRDKFYLGVAAQVFATKSEVSCRAFAMIFMHDTTVAMHIILDALIKASEGGNRGDVLRVIRDEHFEYRE